MAETHNIHATALALEGQGVLLRGPSGSGKSMLALCLLERWQARGRRALLVSDDRVDVTGEPGGLILSAPPAIAGLIELRGRGILKRPFVDSVPLALIVDLVPALERMPEEAEFNVDLFGHTVRRAPVPVSGLISPEHQMLLIEAALDAS